MESDGARRGRGRAAQLRVPPPPGTHRAARAAPGRRDRHRRARAVDRVRRRFPRPAAPLRLAVRPRRGGGWIGAWGSHVVDFLRWTFGDLVDAGARLRTDITERPDADGTMHPCTAEDGFTALALDRHWRVRDHRHHLRGGEELVAARRDPRFGGHARVGRRRQDHAAQRRGHARRCSRSTHPARIRTSCPCGRGRRWCATRRATAQYPTATPTFADGVECARVMDALRGVRA